MASLNVEAAPLRSTVLGRLTRKEFPKDFTFGVATSAYQVEGSYGRGGRGYSIWDVFSNGNPGAITDGSNGNEGVRMYDRYKDDIKLMKIMGFDAYRFSISWPRILPGGKLCLGINQEGIDYYNDLINTIIENGMKPYVTLFHWDLPYLLEKEYGGFLSPKIVDDFRDYAELCFWEFGDRVKHWITTNEAWTYAVSGYVTCKFPPGNGYFSSNAEPKVKAKAAPEDTKDLGQSFIPYRGASVSPLINTTNDHEKAKEAYTVARHLLLSHAAAVQSYRKNFQKLQNGKIGMTNVIHWFEPFNDTEADKLAARRAFDFMLGWFLEPVLNGQYPENMLEFAKDHITPFTEEESNLLKGSCDFLGINYYTTFYASHDPNPDDDEGYNRDKMVKYFCMKPYVTLFHWDLPYLLEKEYGGFLSPKIVDDFREYAEVCFWEFGDRVKHWITTNEAWTYAVYGYVNRQFPPGNGYFSSNTDADPKVKAKVALEANKPLTEDLGQSFIPYRGAKVAKEATVVLNNEPVVIRRLAAPLTNTNNDPEKAKEAYTVARHLLLSHAAAVQSYRKNFQKLQNGKIGMTNNIHWFEPFNDTEADKLAARRAFDFMLGWFLEPVLNGQYPENMLGFAKDHITPFTEEESNLLKGSCDFLGINYYTTCYASHDPDVKADEGYDRDKMFKTFHVKDGKPIGESTGSPWLYIVPRGFYDLLKFMNDTFNKEKNLPPIYITENGCDEQDDPKKTPFEACKDSQRVKYFYDHLQYLYQAIREGIKVESYFAWSFCDNFEWSAGYKTRFGIIHIDFKNDYRRYRKDSATWFTDFLHN